MDTFDKNLQDEQIRINDVLHKLKNDLMGLQKQTSTVKTDIIEIRKSFWEDVTVNFDDAVEAGETATSIKQQAEFLAEREHRHKNLDQDEKNLKRLIEAPYFARIDFVEEGEREVESIYLGIASYLDPSTDEFLIYDWRAPISSLYYDYSLGSAKFTAPGGVVSGELKLKRQFIIKNGSIKSMFDTGITIGDELLQEVLGDQSNTQMKSIVATIQQEQNKVIRNEKGKLLFVQGAAGSGKTSAALQRMAYLLYKHRETLQAEEILLFSPNFMFNSYIRNVLPELGEENMQQTTFQQYLQHSLRNQYEVEDPFTLMEYMLTAKDEQLYPVRKMSSVYKSSYDFMKVIDQYLNYLSEEGLLFHNITFRGNIIFRSDEISSYFYSLSGALSLSNRVKLVSEWLLSQLKKMEKSEREKSWVEEEIQFLSKEEYQIFYEKLTKQRNFTEDTFDDYEREEKMLRKYVVKRHFHSIRKEIKSHLFLNIKEIYRQLFKLPSHLTVGKNESLSEEEWKDVCSFTISQINQDRLPYEDATPYLYVKEKITGFQVNTSVKYVFIDEAQDYSAFQFAFIKQLFPNARYTVLGDTNQAIYSHHSKSGIEALMNLFQGESIEKIILNRSYRSTKPIIEFTREILNNENEIDPFNRQGPKPVMIEKTELSEVVSSIENKIRTLHNYQTIAIICKTAEESQQAYQRLKQHMNVQLIDKKSNEFQKGIIIIPAYLAKGIEFDAVILFNASKEQYYEEDVRNLFYTACTRAMHELFIYSAGQVTPFVENISNHLYSKEE